MTTKPTTTAMEEERQKSNRFLLTKQQICMCIMLFCTFLYCCCPPPPLQHETSLFHTLALWSRWTQHKSCLFHLLHLDTVLSDSTLENFANMSDSLFKWRFRFVFIQKFCYNGNVTWRLLLSISPLSPKSDQHHFSPNKINAWFKEKFMRINKMIT